ncbi:MAG: tRNA (adenosine(37)-N6)-dimethylallyltransferase MiaA, partial [Spirochaetia bacterium]|nr:tRNA (adenosine(37)-N6)-dimethylallyltransferase MiaA [Spirochaetia bacterium]
RGYSKDTPGMKAIGYSEFFEYEDIETVKDRIKHDSCKYAKKQYTYIKDIPGSVVVEFTASDSDIKKVAEIISDFVQN